MPGNGFIGLDDFINRLHDLRLVLNSINISTKPDNTEELYTLFQKAFYNIQTFIKQQDFDFF